MKKKYANEQLLRKIYKLRTHGNLTWQQIADDIEVDIGKKINKDTIKNYYDTYVARANVITSSLKEDKRRAKEVTIDWNKRFIDKFELIDKTISTQLKRVESMLDDAYNKGESKDYIKLLNSLLAISKDIQNQLVLIKRQQETIIVNQKNITYSPLQIMNVLSKEIEKRVKEGKFKIIDKEGKVRKNIFD